MAAYMSAVTYGKITYNAGDNIVVGPIEVPCQGVWAASGMSFNSATSCGLVEQYGWAAAADAAAAAVSNNHVPWLMTKGT